MLTIVFKDRPRFGGQLIDCPEREPGASNKVLTLYATAAGVLGTCGKKHYIHNEHGMRQSDKSECIFPVEQVTPEELEALAAPRKAGRVRGQLPTGKAIDVEIVSFGTPAAGAAQSGGGKAAQGFAAAQAKAGGKAPAPAPARVPRGGGSAAAAFFTSVGQIATATGQVAGSAASVVGSVSDLGKEGIGLARDGVKQAGAYGERRHKRKMQR